MKVFLWLSIFFTYNLAFAGGVRITLSEDDRVLDCIEELSIDGYFCLEGEKYLIVQSFGDIFMAQGKLGNDKKIKGYFIKKIESKENGSLLYESSPPQFPGGMGTWRNVKQYEPPESLANRYSELSKSYLTLSSLNEQGIKPGETYAHFLGKTSKELMIQKETIAQKFMKNNVSVSLTDGSNLKCRREKDKVKTDFDLRIEKSSGNKIRCGMFDCGVDDKGNKRILFSHYSPSQNFSDLLYVGKDGFTNGPQVNKVFVSDASTPLYAYDRDYDFSLYRYGINKPEIAKENYLPGNLKNQSNFFYSVNQPNYELVLRDSGRLCDTLLLKDFKQAFRSYKKKLLDAKLVQHLTIINNVLIGYYLPAEQISAAIACKKDCIYPDSRYVNGITYFNRSFDKRAISKETANELFEYAKSMEDIAWDYKEDGCYARAHLMARRFEAMGIHVDKAWLKGELALKQKDGTIQEWGMHVVPIVYIESQEGKIEEYVIDPSTFDKPVPVSFWARKLNKSKSEVTETYFPFPHNTTMYKRTTLAFSNSTPYLHDDDLKVSEENKLKRAKKTMELYNRGAER
ncbi:MAG: hypothetical protein KAQ98_03155 [Bacteriovoracaceae bacterium]|nr:hypothetical protein [Bacteriovoracaceae bacterium]